NVTTDRFRLNGTDGVIQENYLQGKFGNMMTLCAMLPLLVFSCINSILLPRIPEVVRICGCLAAIFILFLFTSILVKVSLEPIVFFTVTMLTIVLINSFGAVLQGSIFGLAGLLPALYTAPIMSGQGMAGTFAALAMICAIASKGLPRHHRHRAQSLRRDTHHSTTRSHTAQSPPKGLGSHASRNRPGRV
ncbi:equilibrative nucleoside transporter 1-like, partial [Chiloscyllium plagiosum]|uniref:equilibrative nucleoside transporter 1-like n=1 Tax=Chiloscyllium plagiosum TaxID=36176 RepID=UPI001CB81169